MVIGRWTVAVHGQAAARRALDAPLEEADHGIADARLEAIPAGRIGDQRGAVERRAQHRGVADLAAQPAADAGVDHLGRPARVRSGSGFGAIVSDGQPDSRMQE